MTNLKRGDICEIILPPDLHPKSKGCNQFVRNLLGKQCTIIGPTGCPPFKKAVRGQWYQTVISTGERYKLHIAVLRKIEPPKKREEIVDWEDCPWQPEKDHV